MKRLAACVLAVLTVCFALTGCSERGRKNSASRIINQNIVELTTAAKKIFDTGEVPEDLTFPGVENIEYVAPNWLGFQTGGRGVGPETAYCGFYYSPEDKPLGFQGTDMELTPDGETDGVWTWQGEDDGQGSGDNRYYTAHIQKWWFYYEMYF